MYPGRYHVHVPCEAVMQRYPGRAATRAKDAGSELLSNRFLMRSPLASAICPLPLYTISAKSTCFILVAALVTRVENHAVIRLFNWSSSDRNDPPGLQPCVQLRLEPNPVSQVSHFPTERPGRCHHANGRLTTG